MALLTPPEPTALDPRCNEPSQGIAGPALQTA
jgi:hypothetical protein